MVSLSPVSGLVVQSDKSMDELLNSLRSLNINDSSPFMIVNLLTSIKHQLHSVKNEEISGYIEEPIISMAFLLASNANEEVQDAAIPLLEKILSCVCCESLFDKCLLHILATLNNANARTKVATLQQLSKRVDMSFCLAVRDTAFTLLISAGRLLQDKGMGVATAAKQFMFKVAKTTDACFFGDATTLMNELETLAHNSSSEVRFRVYELICGLSNESQSLFELFVQRGLIQLLTAELENEDVLTQLNALELLSDLCVKPEFATHFKQVKVMDRLYSLLVQSKESPDGSFIYPALIKFFGTMTRVSPSESIREYGEFVKGVFFLVNNFDCLDATQRLLGFDTFAIIAATPEGKITLHTQYGAAMLGVMRKFGQSLKSGPLEIRVRHMNALQQMIQDQPESLTPEISEITKSWYEAVDSKDTSGYLISLFKNPIPEINEAIGRILHCVASQDSWGPQLLMNQVGFVEMLFDRKSTTSLEGRYQKYEIVKALAHSKASFITNDQRSKLMEFVKQGPHFVKTDVHVEVEGNA